MKSGIKVELNQGESTALRIILIIDKWCSRAQRAVPLYLKIQLQKRPFGYLFRLDRINASRYTLELPFTFDKDGGLQTFTIRFSFP